MKKATPDARTWIPAIALLLFAAFGSLQLKGNGSWTKEQGSAGSTPFQPDGRMAAGFDVEATRVVQEIDRIEEDTLRQMSRIALDRQGQNRTLGRLLVFDKHLFVNQNEACSFCHTPQTRFTGPIQSLNFGTVS